MRESRQRKRGRRRMKVYKNAASRVGRHFGKGMGGGGQVANMMTY